MEFDASHEIEGNISDFDESHTAEGSSPSATAAYVDSPTAISSLNKFLAEVGMTPYTKTKASQPYYPDQKMKEITESMKQLILSEPGDDDSEMIRQLKDKFSLTGKSGEQMQILTVLPQSWSVKKIEKEFGVFNYMARKYRELVKKKNLSPPNSKPGSSLPQETTDLVTPFYESDEISRVMPGN